MLLGKFARPGSWPGNKRKGSFAETPLFLQLPMTLIVLRMPPSYVPRIVYAHSATKKNRGNAQNATQLILFCCFIKLSKQTLQLFLSQMPRLDIGLHDVVPQTSQNAAFADSLHPHSSLWMNSQSNAGSAILFCVALVHTGPDLLSNTPPPCAACISFWGICTTFWSWG